jgi:hypothetical protein
MASIKIKMKDGTVKDFPHTPRPGGSYTKTIKYVPGFVVITDEYYRETAIPTDLIEEVITIPDRY